MAVVEADRRIRGEGFTSESEWSDWLAQLHPPLLALDDLITAGERLVIVSPHPDDEVLACGGLVAMHAARRGEVAVVAVTDGEASHRGDPAWAPTQLSEARRVERQLGLMRLAVTADSVTRLELPDGDVGGHAATLARGLRRLLKPTDCVVSTWRLDGHPDHDAVGAAAAQTCDQLGCRLLEAPVWMWHWSVPADARVPWHRLRALPLAPPVPAQKAAALAEHATQLTDRAGEPPVLGPAIRARAERAAEYFFV